jgi:ABC-type transport system involved in multi-copper enzyme maturation permease subunit
MPAALVIARLTLREAVRRRLIRVLTILTLVSVGLTGLGVSALVSSARDTGTSEFVVQVGVSQLLIFCAFMFSFILAMTAAFLAAPAIASDIESGVIQALLARPIRRADVVVGRWLGLAVVITGYAVASGLLEIWVVTWIAGVGPPLPHVAVAFLAFESIIMLTLGLLLSTRLSPIAGGAITVVAFGLTWVSGVIEGIAEVMGADVLAAIIEVARVLMPTDALWQGVVYGLEPPLAALIASGEFEGLAEGNPFFATQPPPVIVVVGAAIWVALVVGLAIRWFERREV